MLFPSEICSFKKRFSLLCPPCTCTNTRTPPSSNSSRVDPTLAEHHQQHEREPLKANQAISSLSEGNEHERTQECVCVLRTGRYYRRSPFPGFREITRENGKICPPSALSKRKSFLQLSSHSEMFCPSTCIRDMRILLATLCIVSVCVVWGHFRLLSLLSIPASGDKSTA